MEMIKLYNGVEIPAIGFGTWQLTERIEEVTGTALKVGYKHIDTAAVYGNEREIGNAIKASGIDRSSLFITSKVWNSDRGYDNTLKAFEASLERLQTEYLDLYLIHWPANAKRENAPQENADTWRALEELYAAGKVRAIGLSNFLKHHVAAILEVASVKPMVNQLEIHPGYLQTETVEYCRENEMVVEAWSPIGSGRLLQDETLVALAVKYGVSVATLCIQFLLQQGLVVLPKSTNPKNIESNLHFDRFVIADEDVNAIKNMAISGFSGLNPDEIGF
ncbi:diketogulonate reductase-like aldo/keto reductase [Sphingobacterium allocomposti]|uniref:Diketogulonate reductase-like aldo/keto reductase n=1 Tax=Sphingobacterium allocomposti TaxID=415956 RepID=A0A5S5DLF2_9SPHI|nr:aldo/keto reductase [Sphingobacterium composti Yoo et al. 2007 non Ten et al. 2007]TYP96671.1 diketogulonate reductase-like aldo/keto reductase [Sphingobacterium composti Yoo et al. 2007 non Ten et al. 2007]